MDMKQQQRQGSGGLIVSLAACALLAPVLMQGVAGLTFSQAPAAALAIAPGHPYALTVLMLERRPPPAVEAAAPAGEADSPEPSPAQGEPPPQAPGETQAPAADAAPDVLPELPEFVRPPARVAELATRVLKAEPLNSNAIRALGFVNDLQGRMDDARRFMEVAVRRSMHDEEARYWLLVDALRQQNIDLALTQLDLFYRGFARARPRILTAFAALADHPQGQAAMIEALKADPPWRNRFLRTYPANTKDDRNPMQIIVALRAAGQEIGDDIIHAFGNALVRKRKFNEAYYLWLQSLPSDRLQNLPLLYNGDFELPIEREPFNWRLGNARGAVTEIAPNETGEGSVLQLLFFGERVAYAHTRQFLMLTPGQYRLTGLYSSHNLNNPRGLQWRVVCIGAEGTRRIGESERIRGHAPRWNEFAFEFDVPADDCPAQELVLILPARNAPERMIAGRILFDKLNIERK